MCIIAAKPAGVRMPDDNTITNMWDHNNDGAGFMYAHDGKVHIEKGFMKLKDFNKALKRVGKQVNLDEVSVVMHFRITTHGGTKPENTHPFPVTDNIPSLQKLKFTTSLGVAHNGIISSVSPRKNISDTMEYIATQLAPLYKGVPNFMDNPSLMSMVENATGSKLCFLKPDGSLYTIGTFVEDNGMKYSNSSYKPYTNVYTKYLNGTCYGWENFGYSGFPNAKPQLTSTTASPEVLDNFGGDYVKKLIRPLYESDGDYVIGLDGEWFCGDEFYAVDEDGVVYEYDFDADAYSPYVGATAYNSDGAPIFAAEEDIESYLDFVYIP